MSNQKNFSESHSYAVDGHESSLLISLRESIFSNSLVQFWADQWKALTAIIAVFLSCYFLPVGYPRFDNAVMESLHLVKWYAQEHVLLCLVPGFLIAGAVGAVAFSVIIGLLMHIIFTKDEEERTQETLASMGATPEEGRPLWQTIIYFALMVGILVFANWGKPDGDSGLWFDVYSSKWIVTSILGLCFAIVLVLWYEFPAVRMIMSVSLVALTALFFPGVPLVPFTVGFVAISVMASSSPGQAQDWFSESWEFAKQILPLLLFGILIAGLLLGRPDKEGLIPNEWIAWALGGNSVGANAIAAVAGAFMYFATLTEVPIVQGLIGSGMGKGPALALLLARLALSLPSMLVINSVMGFKKTFVFVSLVCVLSTIAGMMFGAMVD